MNSDKTSKTFHSKMAGNSISKSLNFRIFTERRPRISGPQPPGEGYLPRHIAAFFQNACYSKFYRAFAYGVTVAMLVLQFKIILIS